MDVQIFILTHKEVDECYDEQLYSPLLTGAVFKDNTFGYLTDDTGENISDRNENYAEMTGEYWVWKNINCNIIGFTHRRRWFVKNLKFDRITEEDILNALKTHDIILPCKFKRIKSLFEYQKESDVTFPKYDLLYDDYVNVGKVLEKYFPEYAKYYYKTMNGHVLYSNNMFICRKELANQYFEWLFPILEKVIEEIDLTRYENRDKRICGFLSERLLTTFVLMNELKVKEYELYSNEAFNPYIVIIERHFPRIRKIIYKFNPFFSKFFKVVGIYKG